MNNSYRPGTEQVDLTQPGGVEALLALHKSMFGGWSMQDGPSDPLPPDDGGDGQTHVNEHGYPDRTPIADMTVEQQAAYWKHQSRKHESRVQGMQDYDAIKTELAELKAQSLTDSERAIEDAKKAATAEAEARVGALFTSRLVDAEFRAASAGRVESDKLLTILDGIDRSKFLTASGDVDTDKVNQYVDGIAPPQAPNTKRPDMGQGPRDRTPATGFEAGREMYKSRRPQTK